MTAAATASEPRRENAGFPPARRLTAGNLAALVHDAGLPCVTLTDEDGAAAAPASTAEEGLRIIEDSLPVRVRYASPADNDAAVARRYSHLRWLADFAEDHRWSATGVHSLGIYRRTGELVVLAEVEGIALRSGELDYLPHHCPDMPDSVRAKYAEDILAIISDANPRR